ncbi:MAG: hypothetical protein WCJ51_00580 [Candidatus Moraniibacteriota bacterium]
MSIRIFLNHILAVTISILASPRYLISAYLFIIACEETRKKILQDKCTLIIPVTIKCDSQNSIPEKENAFRIIDLWIKNGLVQSLVVEEAPLFSLSKGTTVNGPDFPFFYGITVDVSKWDAMYVEYFRADLTEKWSQGWRNKLMHFHPAKYIKFYVIHTCQLKMDELRQEGKVKVIMQGGSYLH